MAELELQILLVLRTSSDPLTSKEIRRDIRRMGGPIYKANTIGGKCRYLKEEGKISKAGTKFTKALWK